MTLDEIAKRLEKAQGPDREIDADLCVALLGFQRAELSGRGLAVCEPKEGGWIWPIEKWPLTASLDAAIALVERVRPDRCIQTTKYVWDGRSHWAAKIFPSTRKGRDHAGQGTTAALAALLALIRSIEGEKTNDE